MARIDIGTGIVPASSGLPRLLDRPWLAPFINIRAGFALHNLYPFYTGAVIRARRAADNVEREFTARELASAVYAAWAGAGGGFVAAFYDQAGGADLTIATPAAQPRIVFTDGLPGAAFDGVDDTLAVVLNLPQPFTLTVAGIAGAAPSAYVYALEAGAIGVPTGVNGRTVTMLTGANGPAGFYAGKDPPLYRDGIALGSPFLLTGVASGANSRFYRNGQAGYSAGDAGSEGIGVLNVARRLAGGFSAVTLRAIVAHDTALADESVVAFRAQLGRRFAMP